MAGTAWAPGMEAAASALKTAPRHPAVVRVTHWITTLCFFALLLSGIQIVLSHPRFYWGEVGNVMTESLFDLPVPASRAAVKTGYNFVLPDQNGWSRSLHFQAAWVVVFTGLFYVLFGLFARHFANRLLPSHSDLKPAALVKVIVSRLRLEPATAGANAYNVLQQLTYLGVIFVLFPFMIWTGLAMSPAVVSAFPAIVTVLGGHQSARTLHFLSSVLLTLFLVAHIAMVCLAGFRDRMRGMITGGGEERS